MLQGVDEGFVCLSIHEAVAVPKRHQFWPLKAMMMTWTDVVSCNVKPRVKVEGRPPERPPKRTIRFIGLLILS